MILKNRFEQYCQDKFGLRPSGLLKILSVLVGLSFLLFTALFYHTIKHHTDVQIHQTFQEKINTFKLHLEQSLNKNIGLLESVAKRWERRGGTPRSEWLLEMTYLTKNNPTFQAIEWADPSFHVRWIVPLKGNQQALNLNLGFEKNRKEALMASRDQKKVRVTHGVQLVQGGMGFLIYVPIYTKQKFGGFILGVFRVKGLLKPILENENFQGYNVAVYDGEQIIFSAAVKGHYKHHDKWHEKTIVTLRNIRWSVQLWPKPAMLPQLQSKIPTLVLVTGVLLAFFFSLLIYILGALRGKTDEIAEKSKEMELVFRGTSIIAEEKEFNQAIQHCIDLVCELLEWDVGHAYFVDEETHARLIPSNMWYVTEKEGLHDFCDVTRKTTFKLGEGLPGQIWVMGAPVWIKNVLLDDNFPRAAKCKNLSLKGAVGFPIKIHGNVFAILEFFSFEALEQNDRVLQILKVLGEHLGKMSEKKHAEIELKASEERNRMILESAGEGIYGLDLLGRTTFVNRAAEQMLGYSASELIGQEMHALIHHTYPNGERYPRKKSFIYAAYSEGKTHTVNDEVLWRKDDTSFPVEYTSTPIRKDGALVGAVVTFNDISEKIKLEQKLLKLARYDYLTDLPNRALFDETVKKTLERAQRTEAKFALFTIDLDGFKEVNDAMGHDIGDLVLQDVAVRLRGALRTYDFCARLGGDEFAVIVQDLENRNDAGAIAKKLLGSINGYYHYADRDLLVGASIGISFYPLDADNYHRLMKCSDVALYNAKNNGRNQYQHYQADS